MRNLKIIILKIGVLFFFTSFTGIFRDDVSELRYLNLAAQKQFDCIGRVYNDTIAKGSCVLISEKFVLSAAHVFIESGSRPDTMEMNDRTIIVNKRINRRAIDANKIIIEFNEQKIRAKKIILHPYYLDSATNGSCDLALIELDQPVIKIIPAKINKVYNEANSDVVGVGYGASGPAGKPELVNSHNKKIAGENFIDSIGGLKYLNTETLLYCDFDHPTRKDCNKLGRSKPRPLEYMCAGGDSGGGLFYQKNNQWKLIGICSGTTFDINQFGKTGYYGQIMSWTRVSAFYKWIEEQKQ